MILTATALLLGVGLPAAFVWRGLRSARGRGYEDRRAGLDSLLNAAAGLLLAWRWGSWDVVPRLVYALPVTLTAYGVLLLARHWRRLPWLTGPHQVWKVVSTAGAAGVVAGLALVLR